MANNKSSRNIASQKSLVPSGFSNLFSSTGVPSIQSKRISPNKTIKQRSTTRNANAQGQLVAEELPLKLTLDIPFGNDDDDHDSSRNKKKTEGRVTPGPGDYNIANSPYRDRLGGSVQSPFMNQDNSFELFPMNDTPAPGSYDIKNDRVLTPKFSTSSRKTFMDEMMEKGSYSPGPGDHNPNFNATLSSSISTSNGKWGLKSPARDILSNVDQSTPGVGTYDYNNNLNIANQATNSFNKTYRALTLNNEPEMKRNASSSSPPSNDNMFGEIQRRALEVPGAGEYNLNSPYLNRLPLLVKSPTTMAHKPQTPYEIFSIEPNPGPGEYDLNHDNNLVSHTPKFNSSKRNTYIDESLKMTEWQVGPGTHTPQPIEDHKEGGSGEWGPRSTPFALWKAPLSPSPDAYTPSFLNKPTIRTADFKCHKRGNFVDDEIKNANSGKVATGLYNEKVPLGKEVRRAPNIQTRLMTKTTVPTEQGTNQDVVLRIASNEVTGGFRKVTEQEVHNDYKLKLRKFKDCQEAYLAPSTVTMVAATSSSSYQCKSSGGQWKKIQTGGAIRTGDKMTLKCTQTASEFLQNPPNGPFQASGQYQFNARLGKRKEQISNFVTKAHKISTMTQQNLYRKQLGIFNNEENDANNIQNMKNSHSDDEDDESNLVPTNSSTIPLTKEVQFLQKKLERKNEIGEIGDVTDQFVKFSLRVLMEKRQAERAKKFPSAIRK